ncbi:MAG: chemotaxis protein [Variibacter sp.]
MPAPDSNPLAGSDGAVKQAAAPSLADVVRLAEISAAASQAFSQLLDSTIVREMRDIAVHLAATKREIGKLQANDIKNVRIPAAGNELKAVTRSTEAATNTILACAEAVMAADASDPARYKALVDEKMLQIFEACAFQDTAGQRVGKVVETLQHIEARVASFAAAVRAQDTPGPANDVERERAERRRRLHIHGPQDGGAPPDGSDLKDGRQAEIDKMFD